MTKRIAVVDPSSYTLPYDYFYILRVAEQYPVDFYCSTTRFNWEFAEKLAEHENVRLMSWPVSGVPRLKGGWAYLKMLLTLWRRRNHYAWIHVQWQIFPDFLAWIELSWMWTIRRKLMFTCHNPSPHHLEGKPYPIFRRIRKLARRLLFVSPFSKARFEAQYGAVEDARVVQHGLLPVAPDDVFQWDDEAGETPDFDGSVVFWGNVKPYKNVGFLADMASHGVPAEVSFHVYGKWDPGMEKELDRLVRAGVQVTNRFLSREELQKLLTRPAVFVFPYRDISQSGVLYTYLNYGCVCISSDAGDNGDFFRRHGLEKLLFQPGDPDGACRALTYAIRHYSELRRKMRAIRDQYRWEEILPDAGVIYHSGTGGQGERTERGE